MTSARALQLVVLLLAVAAPVTGAAAVSGDSAAAVLPHETVENPDGNITVLRGAGPLYESIDTPTELADARDDGRLRTPKFLSPGDLLVLQFHSERVTDSYAATSGSNATDRFFRVLESTATNLSVIGLNHGPEQIPSELEVNRSNVEVLHDADTETFSLLVDTANVSVVDRRSGDPIIQTLEHREFQAIVEIPTENDARVLAGGSRFEGVGTSLGSPMDDVHIEGYRTPTVPETAAENLTLTGRTPFLPNTTLTVRASASNGSTLMTQDVETANANTSTAGFGQSEFTTTLPLPQVDANSTVEIAVVRDGTALTERVLIVGQPAKMDNTTARVVTSGPNESKIAVTATLRLPEPGLFLVYVDGEPTAVSVPEHETVEQTLLVDQGAVDDSQHVYPVVVWDRNENGIHEPDFDTLFSTPLDVGASTDDMELDASVRVAGWPPNTTSTTQEQSGTTDEATTSDPATTEPTSTSIPGFGPGIALAGIGLAVVLAIRSRRR